MYLSAYTSIQDGGTDQHSRDKPAKYVLHPDESMAYAWDYPAAREKKIVISIGTAQRSIDIMEIGNLIPFKFNVGIHIHFAGFEF
jgi:vacuolar protein sorting-associated protein 13A/C